MCESKSVLVAAHKNTLDSLGVSAFLITRGTRIFYCQLLCGIYWVTLRERKWEPLNANSACGGKKEKGKKS